MIQKSTKNNPVIGRKIKTLVDMENKGGVKINKGEICTIEQSYRGFGIEASGNRIITRVSQTDITDVL